MMVMFLCGPCDLCHRADVALASPQQCKAAGLAIDAAVCLECLARANPAAGAEPKREPSASKPS